MMDSAPFMPAANYPRNCWWVVATADEVSRQPLGRVVLEQPVVLYRRVDGSVVCLEDRCAHRWAPLSIGRVEGDEIVCGYHGFRYGVDGRCVHIPSQDSIPGKARVKVYPTMELGPFVWIWTGDEAARLEAPLPPALFWANDSEWVVARGSYELRANYMALKENVLDLTHFSFVHAKTLEIMDFNRPPAVKVEGDRVGYELVVDDTSLPPLYADLTGIGSGRSATRLFRGAFVSPAIQDATVEIVDSAPAPGQRDRFLVRVVHLTTPRSPTSTYYWWLRGQDFGKGPGVQERLQATVEAAFKEDKVVLESTQALIEADSRRREAPEVSVRADEAALRMRRIVDLMVRKEAAPQPPSQSDIR